MRRLVLVLGLLVLAGGAGALASAPVKDCGFGGKERTNPGLCRFCPPPEPDCQLVACDRCGCRYWCPQSYPYRAATRTARPAPAPR